MFSRRSTSFWSLCRPFLFLAAWNLIPPGGMSELWGVEADVDMMLRSESSYFPSPGKAGQEEGVSSIQIHPNLSLDVGAGIYAVLAPRYRIGLTDEEHTLFSPDELYVEYVSEYLEVRLGYQVFFWGAVESVNIVDVLNQRDYVGNVLDPEKLGEPSMRLRVPVGENRIDFILFGYFTPAPLPSASNRLNFFDGALDHSERGSYSSSREERRTQAALRWERSFGVSDIGLSYFNGYERFPVLYVEPGMNHAQTLYYEMQQVGGDIQMSLGQWLFKAEAVYQDAGISNSFTRDTLLPNGVIESRDLVPKSHAAWVAGVEYTIFRVLSKMDLGLILEYLYDTEQDLRSVAFRPFQNDVFLGIRLIRNNLGDAELLGGLIRDQETGSQIWRVEYEERFFDRIKLLVGMDRVNADAEDPISVFNNDDRFSIELSYSY